MEKVHLLKKEKTNIKKKCDCKLNKVETMIQQMQHTASKRTEIILNKESTSPKDFQSSNHTTVTSPTPHYQASLDLNSIKSMMKMDTQKEVHLPMQVNYIKNKALEAVALTSLQLLQFKHQKTNIISIN